MESDKISKKQREAFATVGRLGGQAILKKKGRAHMSRLGRRGAEMRWKKTVTA